MAQPTQTTTKVTPTTDKHDPNQKGFGVRGNQLVGEVVSTKGALTATIKITRKVLIPKYKRYTTKTSKIRVHNPLSINAQDGDVVRVAETRPISKTKHFCIVEIVKPKTSQTRDDAQ